jgi:hypothetical protein
LLMYSLGSRAKTAWHRRGWSVDYCQVTLSKIGLEAMQLIELHRRSTRLLNSLHSRRKSERNRDAAVRYNNLRKDVKRFANDSRFARLVPRAWYWTPIRDIPLAVAVLIVGEVVACFILDLDPGALFEGTLMASFAVGLLVVFGGVATGWLPGENWYIASTNQEIWDRANMLHEYVGDLASTTTVLYKTAHLTDNGGNTTLPEGR